ncbi:hypothetical protein Q4I28_004335 [Leishmania naiffi]|uniref:STOP axonemal protein n=1 Tax=Leishmania naiffi TaxID=5678 RepID=A0AAW3BRW6_9TRYP
MTQLHSVASLDYGDGRTCVCRICECGKHQCPGIHVPFVGETTYRDEYVGKNIERERPRRARQTVFPVKAEPGHFKTTNQEAADLLKGKDLRPAESYKPREAAAAPLPFEGTTTNRADFPGWMPEYNRAKRKENPLPKLPGTYATTKGAMEEPVRDLVAQGKLPKPPKSFKADDTLQNSLPFDGITNYTAEYQPKEVPMTRSACRDTQTAALPENRDFQTTASMAYQVPPMHMRHDCPAAFVPVRPASRDGHIKLSVYNIPSGDTMY